MARGSTLTAPIVRSPQLIGTSYYLPELPNKLPILTNPYAPAVAEAVWDWVDRHLQFSSESRKLRFVHSTLGWAELCLPNTPRNITELVMEWDVALFLHDDICVNDPEFARSWTGRLGSDTLNASGGWLGTAINDLWRRTCDVAEPEVAARLENALYLYFQGSAEENRLRTEDGTMRWTGWDDYLAVRRKTIALYPFMALNQIGTGLTEERFRATARAADLCCDHVVVVNDLFSVRKELLSGDGVNAILAHVLTDEVSLQDAVIDACRRVHMKELELLEEHRRLELLYPGIGEYLASFEYIAAGNLHWHYTTSRYHGNDYLWNGIKSGVVELHSQRTVIRRLKPEETLEQNRGAVINTMKWDHADLLQDAPSNRGPRSGDR